MVTTEFSDLIGRLLEAMGQQMDAVRPVAEGLLLQTGDRFLFAFVEDPARLSLAFVRSLLGEVAPTPARLVVLSRTHLPPAFEAELQRAGATTVEGGRFLELVRGLGLGAYVGDEPRAAPPGPSRRLLPSAQQLDTIVHRARTWLDWGVPALALRFYRQAVALKPEFAPARVGIGRALLALGLAEDADRAFVEALEAQPGELDARLGRAAVLGTQGRVAEEVAAYRVLLEEDPQRVAVRSHLLAALISERAWSEALAEVDALLSASPEDPQLRYLRAGALAHLGDAVAAEEERARARHLGLARDREVALCQHLGLPPPELPPVAPPEPAPPAGAERAAPTDAPAPPPAGARGGTRRASGATERKTVSPRRPRKPGGRKPK